MNKAQQSSSKNKIRLIAVALLLGTSTLAVAVDNIYTKLERRRGSPVVIEQGPLPGTVIFTSSINYIAKKYDEALDGNVGDVMARCQTLVSASLSRDFAKNPVQKDEILGFSCWPVKD